MPTKKAPKTAIKQMKELISKLKKKGGAVKKNGVKRRGKGVFMPWEGQIYTPM
jgi:hypothetical protein